jgi:hypothetical protein
MNGNNLFGGYDKSLLMEITPELERERNDKRRAEGKQPLKVSGDRMTFVLGNGAEAGYVAATKTVKTKEGREVQVPTKRFVIVKGSIQPGEHLNRVGKGSRIAAAKPIDIDQAERAFKKYYKNRKYSTQGRRLAAMSYDLRHSPKDPSKIVIDDRYLRNPGKFDYKGLDDGSLSSTARGRDVAVMRALGQSRRGQNVQRYKNKESRRAVKKPSETEAQYQTRLEKQREKANAAYRASQANEAAHRARLDAQNEKAKERKESLKEIEEAKEKRRLARLAALRAKKAARAAAQAGGNNQEESESESESESEEREQQGGRAVSLKTAVRLLRSYYNNKYNKN